MKQIFNNNSIIYRYLLALMAVVLFAACEDDFNPGGDRAPLKGNAVITASVSFDREGEADLKSRAITGGDPGDAIQNINTLWVLVYDGNADADADALLARIPVYGLNGAGEFNSFGDRLSWNGVKHSSETIGAENPSSRIDFNLDMPAGYYYIYAVANVADFDKKDVSSRNKLKGIDCRWIQNDISSNSEMFGAFTVGTVERDAYDSEPLKVSGKTSLHCWARRLASKVTVAFNGTELYENVQIYITDITLKDVPKRCYLGFDNVPGKNAGAENPYLADGKDMAAPKDRYTVDNGLIETGAHVVVQQLPDDPSSILPQNYMHVCRNTHCYFGKGNEGSDEALLDAYHARDYAHSLFFYENRQGTGKLKQQLKPGTDSEIWYPDPVEGDTDSGWKDNKAYGTYVEVTAYYRCSAQNAHASAGIIKYRFMLGQDTDTDYNATRNTHYKLTLKLKGYGNDADWHIEYDDPVGLHVNTPQYISYLYNKDMTAVVKVSGVMADDYRLHAEIIGADDAEIKTKHTAEELAGETYWRPWGDGTDTYPDPTKEKDPITPTSDMYWQGAVSNDGPWNSFLSLRKTQVLQTIGSNNNNKPHYNDTNRGWRIYKVTEGTHAPDASLGGTAADGDYSVVYSKKDDEGKPVERTFSIPLYTRAKELISTSGYTGNNPYTAFPRKQKVKFFVCDANGNVVKDIKPVYLDMIQVRRIVNPKGVWRKSGSTEPFRVTLMWLRTDDDYIRQDGGTRSNTEFESFPSQGPWSAEIVGGGDDIITLSSTSEGSGTIPAQRFVRRIQGADEHPVDFMINFNGSDGCARIRIRYHNYTCEHEIFCREGYDPIAVTDAKDGVAAAKWSSFNVYAFDGDGKPVLAKSPLQEGSLFRRQNTTAILASNNTRPGFWLGDDVSLTDGGRFDVIEQGASAPSKKKWSEITMTGSYTTWKIGGEGNNSDHIATIEEWYQLVSPKDATEAVSFHINKAYGVLYADGATETAVKVDDAYGYDYTDGRPSPKGMRGVIVYNVNDSRQIFFPIGKVGFGHRKPGSGVYASNDKDGTLRYAGRSAIFPFGTSAAIPLFYDLYRRPGAIYWARGYTAGASEAGNTLHMSSAFDMNYFTMSFKGYQTDATPNSTANTHGCFMRTVVGTPITTHTYKP